MLNNAILIKFACKRNNNCFAFFLFRLSGRLQFLFCNFVLKKRCAGFLRLSGRLHSQPAALKAASRRSHELRLGGCVHPLGSGTVSTLPDTLQRGQHAGAGLGTGPHDPSGGQHHAVRCWLGLGSDDPPRRGLNSAHLTFALESFRKNRREETKEKSPRNPPFTENSIIPKGRLFPVP